MGGFLAHAKKHKIPHKGKILRRGLKVALSKITPFIIINSPKRLDTIRDYLK
jgi:hypothetical protein